MYNLLFGQQNIQNIRYFGNDYTTIKLIDMPHYKFLKGNIDEYIKYLKCAWENKERSIYEKIYKFTKLKQDIILKGILEPVLIAKRYNDDKIIIHGNHRIVIAEYLGIGINMKETHFFDFSNIRNVRYGLNNSKKPYQSIFYDDREIIKGRRNDILDRFNCIEIDDIKDKIVIDIGCNLGANCLLMNKYTKKTIGIDINHLILDQAIKISIYFNEPIDYRLIDFEKLKEKVDTCFLYAVDKHIKDNKKITKFIRNNVKNIVYFETHEFSNFPKLIRNCFSSYKLLRNYKGRKLFRCIK